MVGDGIGKPQGISLGGGGQVTVTTSDAFTAAQLIAMQYSLEEPYASNATWLSKRANYGQIRTLVGSSGDNFLWQPGLQAGDPPTLLGRPYLSCNDIPTLTSSSDNTTKLIYFGDWKKAYTIVDRIGIRVVRDMFTSKPFIEFYTYKRVGGQVVLPEAYKIGIGA
jgi:HK97 family phage major capsid protein